MANLRQIQRRCETTSQLPEIVTQVFLGLNVLLIIFVTIWSFTSLKKDEKYKQMSCFQKLTYFGKDLWKKKGFLAPMYVFHDIMRTKCNFFLVRAQEFNFVHFS